MLPQIKNSCLHSVSVVVSVWSLCKLSNKECDQAGSCWHDSVSLSINTPSFYSCSVLRICCSYSKRNISFSHSTGNICCGVKCDRAGCTQRWREYCMNSKVWTNDCEVLITAITRLPRGLYDEWCQSIHFSLCVSYGECKLFVYLK